MTKHQMVKWILIFCLVLSCGIFISLFQETKYEVETVAVTGTSLESWSIEDSVLNGAPLEEKKSIYNLDTVGDVSTVYITVFPTEDENGNMLDFSAFDLHTARNHDYNPVLNANVQFGDSDGKLNDLKNLDQVNATIRVRGNSSRGASFKSYKVKLKEDTESFNGQTVLNINKHVGDVSKITNKFCMDMMSQIDDVSSFLTNFMIVYIRDASLPQNEQKYEYYGLYTNVEQPNKSYLKRRGLDSNGSLYKAMNFEFRMYPELKNVDDPEYDESAFETVLKIREGSDHSKLLKMLNDINDMNQDFNQVFHKYFNEENYLTWIACNVLLGNEDTIAHNFILYNPVNSLTWYMLPWDYDGTFKFGKHHSSFLAPTPLMGIQRLSGVLLHRRYFMQPGNIDKLTAKIDELLETSFTEDQVNSLLDKYRPVLNDTMSKYPDVMLLEMSPSELNKYLNQFYNQILVNYDNYISALKYPMPMFVSEPERREDGSVHFTWETSYSYSGDFIKYNITLARDYKMKNMIFTQKGLINNYYDYTGKLPSGTYYLKVTAVDSNGNEQYSLDSYTSPVDGFVFGVREVVID